MRVIDIDFLQKKLETFFIKIEKEANLKTQRRVFVILKSLVVSKKF